MTTRLLALALAILTLAIPATAEVARVKSGEHADFTRLVIEAPGVKDWAFGRTADGYVLRLDTADWDYDVTGVFDLIPRKRLTSLDGDPQTGLLRLGLACACHAIPFEFRPGLIVVDLRDGPPPPGSSFELPLEDTETPPPDRAIKRPAQRPRKLKEVGLQGTGAAYDWLDGFAEGATAGTPALPLPQLPPPTESRSLDPLRQALLEQMSIGLSNGTIDLAEPGKRPPHAVPGADSDWSRVVLGEMPEVAANLQVKPTDSMTSAGAECIPDERLNLHDWGSKDNVAETFGEIRQGLLGEFDRPDRAALLIAARKLIYLGFGAEAGQLLEAFPPEEPVPEHGIILSLSRLVDGRNDAGGAFAGMALCDSTAALWAALSSDGALKPGALNEAAVRRGFSALPPHLRRALGPGLIERFLSAGNETAVTALREAIDRGGVSDDPAISALDAQIDLSGGHAETAEKQANEVLADPGPATAEAVIALIDAQTTRNVVVEAKTVTTVEALLEEQAGTPRAPALRRALVLARFGAGDVAGAFAALPDAAWATEEAWSLLAERGGDSDLLAQAIVPDDKRAQVAPETATVIAERLLGLGLAKPALDWLGEPRPDWAPEQHLLRGRALLAAGNPEAAIAAVQDQPFPEAATVQAKAMAELGMEDSAAKAFEAAGEVDKAAAARSLAEDWTALAAAGPQDWQTLAQRLSAGRMETIDPGNVGALGRGKSLLGNSETDRVSIDALLQSVPMPAAQP